MIQEIFFNSQRNLTNTPLRGGTSPPHTKTLIIVSSHLTSFHVIDLMRQDGQRSNTEKVDITKDLVHILNCTNGKVSHKARILVSATV